MANASPHPLVLSPILHSKVWGGARLARLGKAVKPTDTIGESWELADLASTSASGAGGGAAVSVIADGPLKGKTLHEALAMWGDKLLGSAKPATQSGGEPRFPLLVKFLDARENLSVQVHPSINYAKANPGAFIKTECWYILDAEPGAVIYKGVKPGVTREVFESHLREGDGARVVDDMIAVPAVVGDMHNLPSGTVHALGAGVLVAEVQTPSDTTFRVYDWGRKGRELHVEQAMQCIVFAPARDATRLAPGATTGRLVTTGFFLVDEAMLGAVPAPVSTAPEHAGRAMVITVLSGSCEIASTAGAHPVTRAPLGSTVVIPACLVATTTIAGSGRVLKACVLGS